MTSMTETKIKFLTPDLRPQSAYPASRSSKSGIRKTSASIRPRSGKSATFTGSDVCSSAANSRPTSGYTVTSRATSARTRDGTASVRTTTLTSTTREGARSPTPNAIKDMEPAFFDVQMSNPGLTIWRVQGSSLRQIEEDEIGFFHEGNAYLVLNVSETGDKSVHFWMGQFCSEKDKHFVEVKAHELDRILCFAHIFSRDVQNYESYSFLRYFPDGIVYIEGKHKTSVKESATYDNRLYVVSGRKYTRAACAFPRKEYLQTENALILDGHPRIYVWTARKCSYITRVKAIRTAQRLLRMQRKGKCHIIVIDETDVTGHDVFAKKLENMDISSLSNHLATEAIVNGRLGNNLSVDSSDHSSTKIHRVVLHRLSGDRVLYDMPEAASRPLHHRYLVRKDSYLLDRGPDKTLYVWVGSNAREEDNEKGLDRGKTFSEHKEYPITRTICRIRENYEPLEFRQCFCDWRDRSARELALMKTYTIGNVERALFSNTDRRTIATVKECWSDEDLENEEGSTQIWVLNNQNLLVWQHHGVFENDKCYVVLYSTVNTKSPVHLVYYWLGCNSTKDDQERIVQLAVEKSAKLSNKAVMVRVLDGKEPQHFMAVLNNWIMVYDNEVSSSPHETTQMFCIRGVNLNSVRIQQVKPCWRSLNSSASFVIITTPSAYLWFGKDSGCMERESTKELLALICSQKMFAYDIVAEGKEPLGFYEMFGEKTDYKVDFPSKPYERRIPKLIHCSCTTTTVEFAEIEDFLQEDLCEEDVLLLDLFDEIFVWCGQNVDIETRKQLPDIAMDYMLLDPAGRDPKDILLLFVTQENEPTFFTKFFRNWDSFGYSGSHFYESTRKRIRQENARIDITGSLIDGNSNGQPKYPYSVLVKKEVPDDVDDMHKEHHLSEKQFRENLLVTRQEFYHLPHWKQRQILRSARLLYTPSLPLHTLALPES